jgi:hypothetical protein
MKPTYLTIVSLILFAAALPAAEPETPSADAVRAAITTFRQDPLSPEGRAAGDLVRAFAYKSDTVLVKMGGRVTPFLENPNLLTEDRGLLQNAFVVGNVDSQLSHNERKDDPYGGMLEVIRTYREMQKRKPTFVLPGLEQFIQMDKRGELKNYLGAQ